MSLMSHFKFIHKRRMKIKRERDVERKILKWCIHVSFLKNLSKINVNIGGYQITIILFSSFSWWWLDKCIRIYRQLNMTFCPEKKLSLYSVCRIQFALLFCVVCKVHLEDISNRINYRLTWWGHDWLAHIFHGS